MYSVPVDLKLNQTTPKEELILQPECIQNTTEKLSSVDALEVPQNRPARIDRENYALSQNTNFSVLQTLFYPTSSNPLVGQTIKFGATALTDKLKYTNITLALKPKCCPPTSTTTTSTTTLAPTTSTTPSSTTSCTPCMPPAAPYSYDSPGEFDPDLPPPLDIPGIESDANSPLTSTDLQPFVPGTTTTTTTTTPPPVLPGTTTTSTTVALDCIPLNY